MKILFVSLLLEFAIITLASTNFFLKYHKQNIASVRDRYLRKWFTSATKRVHFYGVCL